MARDGEGSQEFMAARILGGKVAQMETVVGELGKRSTATLPGLGFRGSLADAKRCPFIGKLGSQGVAYDPWVDAVESLVVEKYRFGSAALQWTKLLGSEPLAEDGLEKFAGELGLIECEREDSQRDLWGLLQQRAANVLYAQIRGSRGQGLESWRRIQNSCNPKNAGAAEAIRTQLVRERPSTSTQAPCTQPWQKWIAS